MMPMLDVQRRSQQIGRIRIGQQVAKAGGGTRPERLTTFRFTTASRTTADAIAALYGGTVQPWEGQRGQLEVVTGESEIWVSVPPRDAVVSQWYEMWGRSGCQRRCDSVREVISGGGCLCPHADDPGNPEEARAAAIERDRLAKQGKACARVTRINVMIPDLPGLGVFRLDTGSLYAAEETGDKADMLELARDAGVFLKAKLRIEWRERGSDRKPYPVPVLEILDTVRDIVTGGLTAGGLAAQLPPAPDAARLAITAAPAASADRQHRDPSQARRAAAGSRAQEIADRAVLAVTREGIEALAAEAREERVTGDMVCTDKSSDRWEELHEFLQDCWRVLPAAEAAG